jgi:nitric oxide reductase NorD protein
MPPNITDRKDPATWASACKAIARNSTVAFRKSPKCSSDCLIDALAVLSTEGVDAYLDCARLLGRMGRGVEPVLVFLEEWPSIAVILGEEALPPITRTMHALGNRRTQGDRPLSADACRGRAAPAGSGADAALPGSDARSHGAYQRVDPRHPQDLRQPGLPEFFGQAPRLLHALSIAGLRTGLNTAFATTTTILNDSAPTSACSRRQPRRAAARTSRHAAGRPRAPARPLPARSLGRWRPPGTLCDKPEQSPQSVPYYDASGIRLPDVLDDARGVSGIDRYRALLAHIAGHRRWSSPIFADNFSPMQRLAIEVFEDSRIEVLILRAYPGLRRIFLALHPTPVEGACDPETVPACAIA